jgi:hypothetical protein
MAFSASVTVPPNGWRISRSAERAKRSGALSAECACYAAFLLIAVPSEQRHSRAQFNTAEQDDIARRIVALRMFSAALSRYALCWINIARYLAISGR